MMINLIMAQFLSISDSIEQLFNNKIFEVIIFILVLIIINLIKPNILRVIYSLALLYTVNMTNYYSSKITYDNGGPFLYYKKDNYYHGSNLYGMLSIFIGLLIIINLIRNSSSKSITTESKNETKDNKNVYTEIISEAEDYKYKKN